MKKAKQRARALKPKLGVAPLLKKGGVHQRKDKRASRARLKERIRSDPESA